MAEFEGYRQHIIIRLVGFASSINDLSLHSLPIHHMGKYDVVDQALYFTVQ